MNDDAVDRALVAAGERWRCTLPASPSPDPRTWLDRDPARSRWASRRVPLAAAAAVVSITAGVGFAIAWPDPAATEPLRRNVVVVETPGGPSVAVAPDQVVKDGDEVEASGIVMTDGREVRFCAPAQTLPITSNAGLDGPCPYFVALTGHFDLDTLANPGTVAGYRTGLAHLRGTWHAGQRFGVLDVAAQNPPQADAPIRANTFSPCPAPPGGWSTGPADGKALHDYVLDDHPEQFRQPQIVYPQGVPTSASAAPDFVQVLVVEVVAGDLDQARQELQRRYDGNLCVVGRPGQSSLSDLARLQVESRPAVDALLRDPATGVYSTGNSDDRITVQLVLLNSELHDEFTKIGLHVLDLDPWLRPTS